MPQEKAAAATTSLDEASPLLLHHQLTTNDNSATASSSLNESKRVSTATAEMKGGANDDTDSSGPSTLLMLEATAKAPPILPSSSLKKTSCGTLKCDDPVDAASSSALVMLVSTTSSAAMKTHQGISDDLNEKPPSFNAWERYNRALEKNPFVVKSITAFFILALGDLCGQAVQQHMHASSSSSSSSNHVGTVVLFFQQVVDWPRTLRFGLLGLVGAPWSHLYFFYLDRYLPPTPNQPCSGRTLLKLVIDQGLQAPAILALMICVLAILKGGTTTTTSLASVPAVLAGWTAVVQADMQANYWTSLVANCKSCTNFLYFDSFSSHLAAAAFDTTGSRGFHLAFGFNNSMMNDGGGGAMLNPLLQHHEQCYEQCLSSRPFHHLVLGVVTGKLWIPASLVNLAFVKPTLRVLCVNVVFFGWTIILSMILNGAN
jgi:hypothetical protein